MLLLNSNLWQLIRTEGTIYSGFREPRRASLSYEIAGVLAINSFSDIKLHSVLTFSSLTRPLDAISNQKSEEGSIPSSTSSLIFSASTLILDL